jgi:hypothetical protein
MTIVAPIMQSITLPKLLPAVEWVGNELCGVDWPVWVWRTQKAAAPECLACCARANCSVVEDSHKGPLNNQGETRLKPAKNAKRKSTRTPK